MKTRRVAAPWVGAVALVLAASACAPAAKIPAAPDHVPAFGFGAPTLDASHPGYKDQQCGRCHPPDGHQADRPPACAPCHGANGACDPRGAGLHRTHRPADPCQACHAPRHQFPRARDCVACHFAVAGVTTCTETPNAPTL